MHQETHTQRPETTTNDGLGEKSLSRTKEFEFWWQVSGGLAAGVDLYGKPDSPHNDSCLSNLHCSSLLEESWLDLNQQGVRSDMFDENTIKPAHHSTGFRIQLGLQPTTKNFLEDLRRERERDSMRIGESWRLLQSELTNHVRAPSLYG
jgi:hypothetical protein